jgi:preprotein translocase subunit SecB
MTDMTDQEKLPHISVNAQYIKDFSFENPGAPGTLVKGKSGPEIDLSLDLNVQRMPEENFFEVEISISAKAKNEGQTLFIVDLKYAGIFNLINIPEEQMQMLLAVHCPSIIFPYARKIISDATQDGGYQPLMIDPIDFGVLYSKKMAEGRPS